MITFWIITAFLIIAAWSIIAPSLLRKQEFTELDRDAQNVVVARDRITDLERELKNGKLTQVEFDQTIMELEQSLMNDLDLSEAISDTPQKQGNHGQYTMMILLILIPIFTGLVYLELGKFDMVSVTPENLAELRKQKIDKQKNQPTVEEMIAGLEKKLQENPENGEGWYMLGRTMMALKKYPKATSAYENAYKLMGNIPQVMLALADAEAMTKNGDLTGRPKRLIMKVLIEEPENTTALWLAAIIAKTEGDATLALQRMYTLQALLAESPNDQKLVSKLIADTEKENNISPKTPPATASQPKPAITQASISVKVTLSPELLTQASPNDMVFIYAKAINGPRFPLAAAKYKVSDLPIEIILDDTKAMMPSAKLSNFQQVTVGARVSKSGQPIPKSGDLSTEISPISVNHEGVLSLTIDKVLP